MRPGGRGHKALRPGLSRRNYLRRLYKPIHLQGRPEDFGRLRKIINAGEAEALYEHDLEVASFYCLDCGARYCGEHWAQWNVFDDEEVFDWHDSVPGRCPSGHQRMLEG